MVRNPPLVDKKGFVFCEKLFFLRGKNVEKGGSKNFGETNSLPKWVSPNPFRKGAYARN